ncbi:TPA: AAA family ATPase [Enterococcus faecium]|nr:AAA family ATPase [Enterococcus faecium]
MQPGMNYYPFYQEAQTRQIADWLIGMNASPLYTLNLQQKGVQGTFSLGRVQTPTLYLIFQRQEAIENFKKEPFFEVEASIKVNQGSFKGVLSPTQRFKTQEELLAFVSSKQAKIGNQEGIIADVQTKEKKTNSPSLFSLSSLQSKVNQLYKATASQTLKAMQGLYEAKLLSYPRTDTPFITENEFAYLKANFGKYSGFLGLDLEMVQTEPRKRYVDGSKVQEHHAIIPTKQVPTESALAKMDDLQRKIYALVVKTTVAMFLPDYLYEETKIQTKVADLLFQSIGKTPKQEGWKILFKQQTKEEKEDVQTLPLVIIGERAEVGVKSVEKETQPPKAFTEGTLLTAMKTANKTVDDEEAIKILQEVEGIGTEATRASIIEALKQKEYIQVIKNKLVVTEKGKLLCQAVESQHLLTSAEMTAKWETYLKKIGKREGNQENFITNIKKFIVHLLEAVPNDIEKLNFSDYQEQKEKGGVGKSKLSTMFAYLTDKLNLKVLMIDKDLQATLTKDLAKTFEVELPRVNFYEGLKNGNLASSIVHLTDNLDLIPGTFDLMLLPKLTRSWTFENESRLLATLLAPLKSDYDLIIIDTVPTPSVYTNNAIVASDYVMIPLQAEEESTNNIQNYISYLIDLQEQFNPGLDMIGFVPYLVDTDSATIKSNLEELYKQHKEDNLVFQNIIKRSNKVSTWSKNGITEHKGYDKKVLSMYENVFFEMLERIIQLENEKE